MRSSSTGSSLSGSEEEKFGEPVSHRTLGRASRHLDFGLTAILSFAEAAVRRQSLRDELNREVCLDPLAQHPYHHPHSTGLLGGESWVGTHTLFTTGEALFVAARGLNPRELFSDQGYYNRSAPGPHPAQRGWLSARPQRDLDLGVPCSSWTRGSL